MVWTRFMDMHSGGGAKEQRDDTDIEYIYIEASPNEAKLIFYNRFGHSPDRITCTCCGEDYSVSDQPDRTLAEATGYERGCISIRPEKDKDYRRSKYHERNKPIPKGWKKCSNIGHQKYIPLAEYIKQENILIIHADEIKSEEREGTIPTQGWVWQDG